MHCIQIALVIDLDIFARKLVILLCVVRPDAPQSRVRQYMQITDTVQQYTATHENILKLVNINRLYCVRKGLMKNLREHLKQ